MPLNSFYKLTILSLAAGGLMACSTTPPSATLLTGLQASDIEAKPANLDVNGQRLASDPVCQGFYANAVNFSKAANRPNPGGRVLAATGLSVLAAVATNGILGGVGTGVGGVAAQTAASQLIFTGGDAAISGLNASRGPDKKIIEKAAEINCPVSVI